MSANKHTLPQPLHGNASSFHCTEDAAALEGSALPDLPRASSDDIFAELLASMPPPHEADATLAPWRDVHGLTLPAAPGRRAPCDQGQSHSQVCQGARMTPDAACL